MSSTPDGSASTGLPQLAYEDFVAAKDHAVSCYSALSTLGDCIYADSIRFQEKSPTQFVEEFLTLVATNANRKAVEKVEMWLMNANGVNGYIDETGTVHQSAHHLMSYLAWSWE